MLFPDKYRLAGRVRRQLEKLRLTRFQAGLVLPFILVAALGLQWGLGQPARDLVSVPLAVMLAWAALIDLERLQLPDLLTLPLIATGLGWAFETGAPSPGSALIGAISGYAVFAGISRAYRHSQGRDGLGLGDAKLFAAAGAWLGWTALPFVALIASGAGLALVLAGSRLRKASEPPAQVAFGPFLAGAFWVVWLLGNRNIFS